MENKDIARKFIKEVAHFMPDIEIAVILTKILGETITYAYVRHIRESFHIHNGRNQLKAQKEKIGLDLYDHRDIIKQEKKS